MKVCMSLSAKNFATNIYNLYDDSELNILSSFEYRKSVEDKDVNRFKFFIADSGAFTAMATGKNINAEYIDNYIDWLIKKKIKNYIEMDLDEVVGLEKTKEIRNYKWLNKQDCVKFVVGTKSDLETMVKVVKDNLLLERCNVLISPIWGEIEPLEIVEFMKLHNLNGYKMQLQIHKFIWDPDERGV